MASFCSVVMPMGVHRDEEDNPVDFDRVYDELLAPAVVAAGFEPIRIDSGTPMSGPGAERFELCDVALVDLSVHGGELTQALGERDRTRPATSVVVVADGFAPDLDERLRPTFAYRVPSAEQPAEVHDLVERLQVAAVAEPGWELWQWLGPWPELSHTKTDVFRERFDYDHDMKDALARARSSSDPIAALAEVEERLPDLVDVEVGVLIDLLLSYRAASAWANAVGLVERLPPLVAGQVLVREQLGLALNRLGRSNEAEEVLLDVLASAGPNPETCSILGRVYKDRYRAALAAGDRESATTHAEQAIVTYLRGFEADWRDAFPGINAVQLIREQDRADVRLAKLVPVVGYAVERKVASGRADYWDHATLLELAIIEGDEVAARAALRNALASPTEPWMIETTVQTLGRTARTDAPEWVAEVTSELVGGTA